MGTPPILNTNRKDNIMKLVTLCIAAALPLICSATSLTVVCPPVLTVGTTVDPSCPGLGAKIIDEPGAKYQVWFEDLPSTWPSFDADYNDIAVSVTFDMAGIPSIKWIGGNSDYDDKLYYGNFFLLSDSFHPTAIQLLALLVPGNELELSIHTPTGDIWYDGPGIRDSDDTIHAYVTGGVNTPEPGTFVLLGVGILGAGLLRKTKCI